MRSITTKLMLVFLAVSLVIITLIFGLASRYTNTTIRDYYIDQSVGPIANELVDYYAVNRSWDGVTNRLQVIMQRDFPEQGSLADRPVLYLLDVNGVLIYPKMMPANSMHMMDRDVRNGVSLILDGKNIGTLIFITRNYNWDVRQPIFLARINRLLYSISAAAIILAIVLGSVLAPRMTRPIRELTAATKAAAAGDLSHKVKVRSDDELGELAESLTP